LLTGDRSMSQVFGLVAVTHESHFESLTLAPYGKLMVQKVTAEAYSEDGISPWALSFGEHESTSVNAILGLSSSCNIPVSWGRLTAKHAEYNATVAGSYTQSVYYADGLGLSGTITNQGLASNQFNAGFGFDFAVNGDIGYQYTISGDNTSAHSVKASIGFQF
jgi:uncharacterized protein YhjY with autotransporter beta-barrel domain